MPIFTTNGLSPKDVPQMYRKTLVLSGLVCPVLGLIGICRSKWWGALLLCISLGWQWGEWFFSIQHDGNHQSYSRNALVNQITGLGRIFRGEFPICGTNNTPYCTTVIQRLGSRSRYQFGDFSSLSLPNNQKCGFTATSIFICPCSIVS